MGAWEGDLLGRADIAEFLQNLLENDNDEIKVVNIDSPWGTGKTFFLDRWSKHLSEERGVVYFNAWEKDYTGDPFVSLVSAIRDQLKAQRNLSDEVEDTIREFTTKAARAVASVVPGLAKVAGKGLMQKLISVESDDVAAVIQAATDEVTDKAVEALIVNSEKDHEAVRQFREVFEKLVKEVAAAKSAEEGEFPVYVFIDELDRCRPTYAIELLERIKHFFDVPGCIFIIATDTRQLGHSIKAVYGNDFDSFEYLKRFFDITYTLDNSSIEEWVYVNFISDLQENYYWLELTRTHRVHSYVGSRVVQRNQVEPDAKTILCHDFDLSEFQLVIVALAKTFNSSLRDLLSIKKHINASFKNISDKKVHGFLLCYLIFLKNSDPNLFDFFVNGEKKLFSETVNERFPPYNLYFFSKLCSVHEIAGIYLSANNTTEEMLNQRLHAPNDRLAFQTSVMLDAYNGLDYSKYFKLVDLAVQIK